MEVVVMEVVCNGKKKKGVAETALSYVWKVTNGEFESYHYVCTCKTCLTSISALAFFQFPVADNSSASDATPIVLRTVDITHAASDLYTKKFPLANSYS